MVVVVAGAAVLTVRAAMVAREWQAVRAAAVMMARNQAAPAASPVVAAAGAAVLTVRAAAMVAR